MRRPTFRPIPTLATLVGLAILASLGTWQYHRYHEKLGLEAELAARADLPPKTASTLDAIDLDADRSRVLTLEGTITRGEGVVFKHRTLEGRPGVWFAAPLELADGSRVVANLGWLPVREKQKWIEKERAKPPESGSFTGLLHVLDQNIEDTRMRARIAEGEADPGSDVLEWNSYDVEALTALYGALDERPDMVFVLTDAHSGDPFPLASTDYVTKPYMTSDRHLGYSAFWYTTGVALLLIYLGASFGLIGSRRRVAQERPPRESSEDDSLG